MASAFKSPNFGEPRSPNTLLQLRAAEGLQRLSTGFARRAIPVLRPWSVQLVTDWGADGKRLESEVSNYSGRRTNAEVHSLSHEIPKFKISSAALFLESNIRLALPNTVFVCVVDPTVGSDRKPIAVQAGNNSFFVGPHNGVFDLVLRGLNKLYGIVKAVEISRDSMHVIKREQGGVKAVDGDALFAPAAGAIIKARGIPASLGKEIPLAGFGEVGVWKEAKIDGGKVSGHIEAIEHYGSFVTNIPSTTQLNGAVPFGMVLKVTGGESRVSLNVPFAEHFSAVPVGSPLMLPQGNAFWHLAINQGEASKRFNFIVGEPITVEISRPAQPS